MVDMEPVIAPLVTQIAFRLGDLIGVVGESIVNAAGVDIQILPQMLDGNAGAFDMPAGIAHAPRRVPFQRLILELALGEPENEVVLVFLIGVLFHALPDAYREIFLVMVVEDVILLQSGGVKVHVAPGEIGTAFVQQGLHHVDILADAVGRRLHHVGTLDVQLVAVGKKGVGIVFRDLHDGLVLPPGALEHLVLAGIGVGSQMADVSDVHDPLDVIAQIPQGLFQHIFHNVGAQVADVGVMVHRGAAGVHFHQIRVVGNKQLLFMGQGIVQIHVSFLHLL